MTASRFPDNTIILRQALRLLAIFLGILCFGTFSASGKAVGELPRAPEILPCASAVAPKITLNGPATICAGGSVLLTASHGTSYKWSNGATSRSITVTQTGEYFVDVVDEKGCVGRSEVRKVEVAAKLATPKIEYTEPLIVCEKGSVTMRVQEQEGAAYIWKKDGKLVYDKSNEYTTTEAGVYTVELSNFCGYVRSSNKVEFIIQNPLPAFNMTAASNLVFCRGGNVNLSVPAYKNVTFAWFLDGKAIPGNTHTLEATEAGVYTAAITSECGTYKSSNSLQVELLELPAPPTAEKVIGCTKSALTLNASDGKNGMYRWYTSAKGGAAIPGANGPSFTTPVLASSTTYYVAITNGQCESERVPVEAIIQTKPEVATIQANGDLEFCEGGAAEITSTKTYSDVEYIWLRDGKAYTQGSSTLQATESGVYTLKLQNDCGYTVSSNSIKVRVWPSPEPPVAHDGVSCGPGKVLLSALGGVSGEFRWYEDNTTATAIPQAMQADFETPRLTSSRTYYVSVVRNGCETERVPVQALVYPVPVAAASVQDLEIDAGDSTRLLGSGGVSYSWSPIDGLDDPASASPMATPDKTTRYTLTVRNDEGCEDTVSVVVQVRQLLEIPNAFSPNGDGVNDTWEIKNIEYFPDAKVEIFNRWGNLIFERTNYRNEWAGTYRGAPLPVSTYFYVVTVPGKATFTGYLNIVN